MLYEDDVLLALHKPAGIETHPHRGGVSLLNIALGYVRKREPSVCLHPVHRLDVGTEGVLLFAKHGCAQALLMKEMEEGSFRKEYVGVVRGSFIPPAGSIRLPIAHDPARGAARFVSSIEGKDAWTDYETVRSGVIDGVDASLVRFLLHTGRTHQIRVHAAALGHPLLGDPLYGGEGKEGMYRLCATRLAFPHPVHRPSCSGRNGALMGFIRGIKWGKRAEKALFACKKGCLPSIASFRSGINDG